MMKQITALMMFIPSVLGAWLLPALPEQVVDELANAAYDYGWHAVNIYAGSQGNAAEDQRRADGHVSQLRTFARGLLQDSTVDLLRDLAQLQGWYAAEVNNPDEQSKTGEKCDTAVANLKQTGELSNALCENIRNMLNYAAWYTQVARYDGESQEARENKAKSKSIQDSISGSVVLKSLSIDTHGATVSQAKPVIVGHNTLVNEGAVSESQTFTYSHTTGRTTTWDFNVGFSLSIEDSLEIDAEFLGVGGKETVSMTFQASFSASWGGSSMNSNTKQYQFILVVPPHSTYTQTVMVQEAEVSAPYTMVMNINGFEFQRTGTWHGVADSEATSDVKPEGATWRRSSEVWDRAMAEQLVEATMVV